MNRMDNYLEKWAMMYKPVSHDPTKGAKGKRFYRIDAITSIPSFVANLINAKSPSIGYITQIDATLTGNEEKFLVLEHRVFVFVKQAGTTLQNGAVEEVAAAEAKAEGMEVAQDLLAYIKKDKRNNKNTELEGQIDYKGASIFTTPQQFNGWWPTELVFSQIIPRKLCIDNEKYYDETKGSVQTQE